MFISSYTVTNCKLNLDHGSIGDCMLKSMRDQRNANILCDAIVQCGKKQFPVHRSILYACSLYCRKLFTCSFPPKTDNGLVMIDLGCFSENVVRTFLDMIYQHVVEDTVYVEVEEFFKLVDFLQADSDIDTVTELFRNILDNDNCLELYELSGAYNLKKLHSVVLAYIGTNLEKVINTVAWKGIKDDTLLSLMKNPLIQCNPAILVGKAWKSCFTGVSNSDILMGVNAPSRQALSSRMTDLSFIEIDSNIAIQRRVFDVIDQTKLYFVFHRELYCVVEHLRGRKFIFKYFQSRKQFHMIATLNSASNAINDKAKKLTPLQVLVDEKNEDQAIVMCVPGKAYRDVKEFSLVKLPRNESERKKENKEIELIPTTFKPYDFSIIWNSRDRKIYFLKESVLYIYNIEDQCFVADLPILNSIDGELNHLTVFNGDVYCVTHDNTVFRLYLLDRSAFHWHLHLEEEMKMNVTAIKSCSSSSELAIIFENDLDHIYKLDPELKTLTFYKSVDKLGSYLFVPDHIYL